jgi:thiol-disulfide isomerase/thioredoxin
MHRLLFGTCVLALAMVAVRADDVKKEPKKEEKKSVAEQAKVLSKDLRSKIAEVKSSEERAKVLVEFAGKFVDLAKANIKDPVSVGILTEIVGLPIPDEKDGPKSRSAVLLKGVIDDSSAGKELRAKALQGFLNAQEKVITLGKDAKAVEAARADMAKYRKLIPTEFKDVLKDLYVGAVMPELTSKDLEDKDVKLSDLKGKVVVVDVWATWCGPCKAMIPHSKKLVEKLKGKPFVLVSISADAAKADLTDFLKKTEMPWTHWWNGEKGGVLKTLGVTYFPTIYVIDSKGVIRFKDVREEEMDKAVETLLKEMETKKAS